MLSETWLSPGKIDDSVEDKELAETWDHILSWLWDNLETWKLVVGKKEKTKVSFTDFVKEVSTQTGGKFLRTKLLRAGEPHRTKNSDGEKIEIKCDRYVIMDGTHDIAELIVDSEEDYVRWLMVYRAQNLVHLIQTATKYGVKVIE